MYVCVYMYLTVMNPSFVKTLFSCRNFAAKLDGYSMKIIKQIYFIICSPLTVIFQNSIF